MIDGIHFEDHVVLVALGFEKREKASKARDVRGLCPLGAGFPAASEAG